MELHQLDLLYGCVKGITLREETEDSPEQFINAIGEKYMRRPLPIYPLYLENRNLPALLNVSS
jgi:hypothetical protein